MQKIYQTGGFLFKYFCIAALIFLASVQCEAIGDSLRNWGEKGRRPAKARLNEKEVRRWERDLNLSRARTLELHDQIQNLVQESNRQGMLAWKIGKAYLEAGRYDLGAHYYQSAIKGEMPAQAADGIATFEQAIPYFEEALLRHQPDPELLFEAGLCFANASRAAGWERHRWRTALLLFQRMARAYPDDIRSRYQLAMLYGKTSDAKVRDVDTAIVLLDEVLNREPQDISARFLLGQLLVEQGDLNRAAIQYREIVSTLEDLHRKGLVPGAVRNNPRYQKAQENLEVVEACMRGGNACIIGDEP